MSARRRADEKQATLDVPPPTAHYAVERTATAPRRINPDRIYRHNDRVLVLHLGNWIPGIVGKTYQDSVLVIADDREVPPITVYDAKYLRREE